jgi:hypothetical protein
VIVALSRDRWAHRPSEKQARVADAQTQFEQYLQRGSAAPLACECAMRPVRLPIGMPLFYIIGRSRQKNHRDNGAERLAERIVPKEGRPGPPDPGRESARSTTKASALCRRRACPRNKNGGLHAANPSWLSPIRLRRSLFSTTRSLIHINPRTGDRNWTQDFAC